jgi:chromosome partitioning protein
MATVISFYNNKGGVGKTTACVTIASLLADEYKVLMIDNDVQGNLSEAVGIEPDSALIKAYEGKKVDFRKVDFTETLEMLERKKLVKKELYILTGGLELLKTEDYLKGAPAREKILQKNLLPQIKDEKFDFVLIDNSPSLSVFVWNALCMSDYAIIPFKPSKYELRGIDNLFSVLKTINNDLNHNIKILGIFINMYQENKLVRHYVKLLRDKIEEDKLFSNGLTHTSVYGQAAMVGLPVDLLLPPSDVNLSNFIDLKNEILKKLGR